MTIYAGSQVVIVRGRELRPVTEALDAGKLAVLRTAEARYLPLKMGTAVVSIEFTSDAA